jgi:DHA2 family multidrug resistance protein
MINRFIHDPPYIKAAGKKIGAFDNIGFATLIVWTGCLQVVLDKGQEVDWFGAVWVRWAVLALVAAFITFVWRSWNCKYALVDLKVLKDRNFLLGSILIFMFGIGIYSTVTVLPLFYQELLGYTAFTAGLVVAPRGLGAICGMPVIGYLSNKVDPRYLLTFGFLTFGLTTLYFGSITLGVSPTTLFLPILITGFGLSFVFVPISTAAYGTLKNEQIGNASGVFNLMRNIGGSIGISVATTLLTRRSASHQSEILNSTPGLTTPGAVQGAQHALNGYFGHANSLAPAQATLYQQLIQQASLWSFIDVFRWLSMLCFACVIIVWFFKKVKPGKAPAGAH